MHRLKIVKERGVVIVGRILVIELSNEDSPVFEKIMDMAGRCSGFDQFSFSDEHVLSVAGLDFYPVQKRVCCGSMEIGLTVKEFEIFYLLAVNKGRVLTYNQIYSKIWNGETIGNEKNAVKCHIRNLREKLYTAVPEQQFVIKCVREVGYCFNFGSK